jgi:acid phosphatase
MASLSLNHHNLLLLVFLLFSCDLRSTTANSPKVFDHSGWISKDSTAWDLKQPPQDPQLSCEAWRFGVESNTLRFWNVVPPECVEYVKDYMVGSQYLCDSNIVANESIAYANSLNLSGDGKDVWVFDVDETLLSNLPLFAAYNYGGAWMDDNAFIKWADLAEAPALPASQRLYARLLQLGFKIFLLTGRYDYERIATEKNLVRAGYHSWEALFLRGADEYETSAVLYKSERRLKIEKDGFRIRGNSGDQWTDLSGYSFGDRTFKLPNPMYFIA